MPARTPSPFPAQTDTEETLITYRSQRAAKTVYLLPLSIVVLLLAGATAPAQEWTRFRGPNGAGQSDATTIPAEWTASDYHWKVELPGIGHACPVIWGEKVFVNSGDSQSGDQILQCLSVADGRTLWQKRFKSSPHHLHARNSFATSTPAVDADHIYLAWAAPDQITLVALDHQGEEVWQADLGPFDSSHGYGTSPIVLDDLVILGNDQRGPSSLIALDRLTGEIRWRAPRTALEVAYSTPCVYRPPGGDAELIFLSERHGMTSIDPRTGKTNWENEVFDKRTVGSPIVIGDLVLGACGSGGGGNYVVAVRPGDANGRAPELAYKVTKSAPYVPTPVAYGDLAFLWSDKGVVTCIEAATGTVYWQERVPGNYSGSPVRVADRIYCISEEGDVVVLAAAREFKLLGRNPLGDYSRSTPAISGGRMYLRTNRTLVSLGK